VTYHRHWRGCGGISDEEVYFLAILRSGGGFVQRIENHLMGLYRKNLEVSDDQADVG
jgi:hypothetical protein